MLRDVRYQRLRGFDLFEMRGLGRINLVVGTNNCGKTTVLEGIRMLSSPGDFSPIWSILSRRGEELWDERDGRYLRHMDVRRLFHGHSIDLGSTLTIDAVGDSGPTQMEAQIIEVPPSETRLFEEEVGTGTPDDFGNYKALRVGWRNPSGSLEPTFILSRKGGLSNETVRRAIGPIADNIKKNLFITAAALSPELVIELFESIVLTPEEDSVVEALRVIEPSIERIATSGTERSRAPTARQLGNRGGMLVRCKGIQDRIPIGSMGDGIWRMLGLSLALVHAEGGILLIDEIDTGLHFSVLADMWRLVYRAASRFNVQVFASTHSRDCYESLAVICRESVAENSDITIQRIERGKHHSIAYTEQEIIAAAARGMEVR